MTTINFFEQFAKTMKKDEVTSVGNKVIDDVVINKFATMKIEEIKNKKDQKNLKNKKDQKKLFNHSKNVLMTCGNYKGYSGFVYEYYQEKLNVSVEEYGYVLAQGYSDAKVGDKVMTMYGDSMIVSKVDMMYKIISMGVTISLPKRCFIRLVTFIEGGVTRVGQFMMSEGEDYELAMLNLNYEKGVSCEEILRILSDALVSGKYTSMYGMILTKKKIDCGEEYYMVCESSKGEVNYFGRYGKLCNEVPEQYLVKYEKIVNVVKNAVEVENNQVIFKNGIYKGRCGKLLGRDSATLSVQIEALVKTITEHFVKRGDSYCTRKIVPGDVFYCDIELTDGSYFQVNECYDDRFVGIKRATDVEITVTSSLIKRFMPGFRVISLTEKLQTVEEDNSAELLVNDEDDVQEETDVVVENDEVEHGFYDDEVLANTDVGMNTEGELKESFKDVERSFFVQRSLSKDEKEYMKMIEKCVLTIGDVSNIYTILDSVNEAISMMKIELGKLSINEWKNTDTKYIIACLVVYDMIRSGCKVSSYDFKKMIVRLYDSGYITKNTILNSSFIRSDNECESDILQKIQMSSEKKKFVKKMYKESNYIVLVELIMENCNIVLQECFGTVTFDDNKSKIEIMAVSKPHAIHEYPKYFLTTQDIMNDTYVSTATRVLWCPRSQELIKIWKRSLSEKYEKESNDVLKCMYKYILENLENAPFVLRTLELSKDKMDVLKYRELKRSYDTFKDKLRLYLEKSRNEKLKDMEELMLEKDRVSKRRLEISSKNGIPLDAPDINMSGKRVRAN